jgi:hypothetical protein
LLISAEATNAAQAMDMTDEARSAEYVSPFDRVFFIDCTDGAAQLRMRLSGGKSLAIKRPVHNCDASRQKLVGSESRRPADAL